MNDGGLLALGHELVVQLLEVDAVHLLALEKIEAAPSGVQVLAREAAGSMRDAMSLLDQVIAYSGDKLSGEDVARVLGVADRAVMHELASALVQGDAAACLGVIERVAEQGYDIAHTTRDLLRHLRNLVVAKVSGEDVTHPLSKGFVDKIKEMFG